MKYKNLIIIVIAIIIPFGFIILGLWKAYELLKEKEENEKTNSIK